MASAAPVGQDHPNYDSKHHIRYKEQNSVDTTNTCSDNRCSYRGGGGSASDFDLWSRTVGFREKKYGAIQSAKKQTA